MTAGGTAVTLDGVETDAELAAVARENGIGVAHPVSSATFLRVHGKAPDSAK